MKLAGINLTGENKIRILAIKIHVMQTKLTLTLDRDIIEKAKRYAKAKERSLSQLIENYLKVILEDNPEQIELSSSVKKLKGAIKLPDDFDYKKELSDILYEKHKQ